MTVKPVRRRRYGAGEAPRTLCYDLHCRAAAHYQGVHNLRFYCAAHAAAVAAIVPLREIDGLTEALRSYGYAPDGTITLEAV